MEGRLPDDRMRPTHGRPSQRLLGVAAILALVAAIHAAMSGDAWRALLGGFGLGFWVATFEHRQRRSRQPPDEQ